MDDLTRAIDARREIGKWLNEEPNREVDRRALAELCVGFDLLQMPNKEETDSQPSHCAYPCVYPDCNCPFDAPADPNWCARGLPNEEKP